MDVRRLIICCGFFAALLLAGCSDASITVVQEPMSVTLLSEPSPPLVARPASLTLQISDTGRSLQGATVAVRRSMPGMNHADDQVLLPATDVGGGTWLVDCSFSMGGRWDVAVVVTLADGATQTLIIPLTVEQP